MLSLFFPQFRDVVSRLIGPLLGATLNFNYGATFLAYLGLIIYTAMQAHAGIATAHIQKWEAQNRGKKLNFKM